MTAKFLFRFNTAGTRNSRLSVMLGGFFLSLVITGCLPNLAKQLDPRGAVGSGSASADECFASFTANAAAALGSGTCLGCHGTPGGGGTFLIPSDISSYTTYNDYLRFVDRTNNDPAQSLFILKGTGGGGHGGGNVLSGAALTGVTTWIQREIQGNCGG